MEYINGSTLSLFLMTQPLFETNNIFRDIINFIFNCKKNSFSKHKQVDFIKKIYDIKKKIIFQITFIIKSLNP